MELYGIYVYIYMDMEFIYIYGIYIYMHIKKKLGTKRMEGKVNHIPYMECTWWNVLGLRIPLMN